MRAGGSAARCGDGGGRAVGEPIDAKEAKPGMRVKAVFREKRTGQMSDFVFNPIDE